MVYPPIASRLVCNAHGESRMCVCVRLCACSRRAFKGTGVWEVWGKACA